MKTSFITVLASRERSLNILLIHSTTKVGIVWRRTLTFNLIKIFWKTLILFVENFNLFYMLRIFSWYYMDFFFSVNGLFEYEL